MNRWGYLNTVFGLKVNFPTLLRTHARVFIVPKKGELLDEIEKDVAEAKRILSGD